MSATDIMALAALFCCGVGIAGVLWGIGQHRARQWADAEVVRLKIRGADLWDQLLNLREDWQVLWWADVEASRSRSRAVSAGNRTRAQQQQARKAETTQRLERVAARKRGRVA